MWTSIPSSIPLYVDNQSAIALSQDPVHHNRSKHIDIKLKYIVSQIKSHAIMPVYIPTNENIADIFTKSQKPSVFRHMMSKLVSSFNTEQ
jgi:hypothetical protein